jgi:signal transduction histidine kinase
VRSADPHQPAQLADAEAPADEIGELAGVFDQYLVRLRAFIERERAFVADVSHELRTPLAVIQGAGEVLQEDARLDEGQHQRVTRIERAAAEMTELIRSLLLLAREEETDRPSEADCDAAGVLHDCVERSRHLLGSRGTTVEVDIRAHPHLAAEPALFAVVVGNLIRNAFAYTETGRVTIRLESGRLVVSDTGIGIKAEEIGRVFQRYYKGAASRGSGIGLSLTKRICDRYGWTLAIESREAQGTSARLEFGPAAS